MMIKVLTALGLVLASAGIAAQDPAPINLKGHWIGTSESIVRGKAMHHRAPSSGVPMVDNVAFDFAITGQDGRRFWGSVSSKTGHEPIIGVIAMDATSSRRGIARASLSLPSKTILLRPLSTS